MNNLDYTPLKNVTWKFVFEAQKEILQKYEKIDLANFDINVGDDQNLFKDFLMLRFTEEISEASEELEHYVQNIVNPHDQRCAHFKEEIIDALNFLLEAYIIYGWDESKLDVNRIHPNFFNNRIQDSAVERRQTERFVKAKLFDAISAAGLVCNVLKCRPWRQQQYLVDLMVFEDRFKKLWDVFMETTAAIGINQSELLDLWSLKYQCNKFRIDTGY